jgi:mannosyltransferase OCH1-like enzyme
MILNTKDINFYYLTTTEKNNKVSHIEDILQDFKLNQVLPFELGVSKEKSGSIGHARMIECGLRNQDNTKPFQPFVILEDDISFYREMPKEIDIPNDSDLLYLGLSQLSMNNGEAVDNISATEIDENTYQIFNMLSGHAIMVCSALGAAAYQKAMIDGFYQDKIWDVFAAEMQINYNVYALKKPIFIQDAKLGGRESATNFELCNKKYNKKVYSNPIDLSNVKSSFFNNSSIMRISYKKQNLDELLEPLSSIPKKIHISWKDKSILESSNQLAVNGIQNILKINPDWELLISDDYEVESYLKTHLPKIDYELIKDSPIVTKVDTWRLLVTINEGGLYMDIDRHANKILNDCIEENIKCVIPMHSKFGKIIDFSQDIMISAPDNPLHKAALDLLLRRRRSGWTDILTLAPITYFHALTKLIHGHPLERYPSQEICKNLISKINNSKYAQTFIEKTPEETFIFKYNEENFKPGNGLGKEAMYNESGVEHWGVKNPIDKSKMKFL